MQQRDLCGESLDAGPDQLVDVVDESLAVAEDI